MFPVIVGIHQLNGSPLPKATDPESSLPGVGNPPAEVETQPHTLMHVLNTLGSDVNMNSIKMLLKEHKRLSNTLVDLMKIFPPMREGLLKTEKINPEFRTLFKVATGKIPSLTDLFDIATTHRNMWNDYVYSVNAIPSIQKVYNLMNQPKPDYKKIMNLLLGAPSADTVNRDKYSVKTARDNPHFVDLVHFFVDNWVAFQKTVFIPIFNRAQGDNMYVNAIRGLENLDYTHLPTSLSAPGTDGKYAVGAHGDATGSEEPDPDLAHILHDVRVDFPEILKDSTGADAETKGE